MILPLGILLLHGAARLWLAASLELSPEEAVIWACLGPERAGCEEVSAGARVLALLGEGLGLRPELALRLPPLILELGALTALLGRLMGLHGRTSALRLALGLGALPGLGDPAASIDGPLLGGGVLLLAAALGGGFRLLGAGLVLLALGLLRAPQPEDPARAMGALLGEAGLLGPGLLLFLVLAPWTEAPGSGRPRPGASGRARVIGLLLAAVGLIGGLLLGGSALPRLGILAALLVLAQESGRWARALDLMVGPGILLGAAVGLHLLRPWIALSWDPRQGFVGGRVLGEAVAAWGAPAVWTEERDLAGWVRAYGGREARLGLPSAAESGLYVRRPGAGRPQLPPPVDGPHEVRAWLDGPRLGQSRLIDRYQIYAFGERP